MWRLVKMNRRWFALKIKEDAITEDLSEQDNIQNYLDEGQIVVLCDDLDVFKAEFDLEDYEVEIVQ